MSRSSQKSKPFLGGNIFHYSDHLVIFTGVVFVAFNPPFHLSNLFNYFFIFLFLCVLPKLQLQQLFFHPFLYWIRFHPKLPIRSSLSNHSREDANKLFWVSGRTLVHARTARLQRLMVTNELFLLLPPTCRFQVPKQVLGLD